MRLLCPDDLWPQVLPLLRSYESGAVVGANELFERKKGVKGD